MPTKQNEDFLAILIELPHNDALSGGLIGVPPINTDDPIRVGKQKAEQILAGRRLALEKRKRALAEREKKLRFDIRATTPAGLGPVATQETAGFLLAVGDSWFDYPFHDVLKLLEDEEGYDIESAAHRGDPIESMAYQGGQLDKFARCLEKILARGAKPKAVLLSGGGDDIAGKEFGMLLNNATSSIAGWNSEILDGVINDRVLTAYKSITTSITEICAQHAIPNIPILVHGYDYPVPDGRGFAGGWPFPGPWLEPGFDEKLFTNLQTNVGLMRDLIDRFNRMLSGFSQDASFTNIRYIDLRGTLSTDLTNNAYQQWWANELHPTEDGFDRVTERFEEVLAQLP
ncbi:MAG TPA: hypothetical protein VFQ00_09855 [Terriglobales bacterium]|nr:hypothetical protein [Terriglobales bacterium]